MSIYRISPVLVFLLLGCESEVDSNRLPERSDAKELAFYVDKKISLFIADFGPPDVIRGAESYQAKFMGREATVVMEYVSRKQNVYVSEDAKVIAIVEPKVL